MFRKQNINTQEFAHQFKRLRNGILCHTSTTSVATFIISTKEKSYVHWSACSSTRSLLNFLKEIWPNC